ncbi:MAG: hypothetical protein JWO06_2265 [Bacteroidota bacterium]|nr:hypothetical protein [Bacteroidota bacterium]
MFKFVFSFLLVLILTLLSYLNYKLYYQPRFISIEGSEVNADLYRQLNFLEEEMHKSAADDMQAVFPEGFIFMNALYGLSLTELAAPLKHNTAFYHHAHDEIQWAFAHMNSDKGRIIFDKSLKIPYGAFYTGWTSYVLGKKLSIEEPALRDTVEISFFESRCKEIAAFIDSEKTPYAESYPGYAWPADMTLCAAALALHDKIRAPKFQGTIQRWIGKVNENLDTTGLMPHSVNAITGRPMQNARGSSQSLMLNFLWDVDTSFAKRQFDIYQKIFLVKRLGLPGTREYPKGVEGDRDSDSGPVVWGVGASASIVGLRATVLAGDETTAIGLRNSLEAFGIPTGTKDQKKFLFGKLPMADAFIAWSNSTETSTNKTLKAGIWWRSVFQLYSFATLTFIVLLLVRIWKPKGKSKVA